MPAKQRQIYVQGADPLERLANPFLRSRGALLEGEDFRYQMPAGRGSRHRSPDLDAASSPRLELERTLVSRPKARLFSG